MDIGLASYSLRHAGGIWGYVPQGVEPLSPEGYLRIARKLELDGVHFTETRHFGSFTARALSALAGLADSLGLFIELGTSGTDPEHLREVIGAGHLLSSRSVRTCVGGSRLEVGAEWPRVLDRAAANIRAVVPMLEDTGVRLAIENHQEITTPELLALVDAAASDLVGVCLDTTNQLFVLEDVQEAARLLTPRTHSMHVADVVVVPTTRGCAVKSVALGRGWIDNDELVRAIAHRDRGVRVNLETPVERIELNYLDPEWRKAFGEAAVERFDAWVRALRASHVEAEPEPWEQLAEGQLLEAEMNQARQSANYARTRGWRSL